jgi:RHS repeat-associated protein
MLGSPVASELSLRWTPPSSSQAVVPGTALFPSYGRVTKTTDPDGKVSKTEYQDPALAAPTAQVADPAGLNLRTETSYEAAGTGKYFRRLTRTLPKGAQTPAVADDYQTSYSYWDNGQMQPNPCTGGNSYNQGGMLKQATSPDPAGSQGPIVNQYRYDGSGRVMATQVAGDANWRCTSYDARGRVTRQSATDGKTIEHNYSVAGQVTTTYEDSGGTTRTTVQKTDWIGRPVSYTDEHGVITRTTFDRASRPKDTFRTYPVIGIPLVEVALASYDYDDAGNLSVVADHLSGTPRSTGFGYDAGGKLSTITRPNGVVTTNAYSATRGWLDQVSHAKTALLTSSAYTRSDAGRVATETTPAFSRAYSYDGAGRLFKTVDGSATRNYSFDANSNRCSAATACDSSYAYDDADRVTASPGTTGYGYDSHGNLTSISSKGATIGYDGWDHATAIKPDSASAATTETLAPSGRVIRRLEPVLNLPVIDTAFGYSGEGDSPAYSGPVVANLLVLLPLTITSYISGPAGLLTIDTGGSALWPLLNGHGDVVGTTDAAGTYTANPVTDEFGVGAVPASRLGYLGGAERFSTGGSLNLIRMGVRLYDPALGRFLQVDPIEGGSANDYDYALSDPCNNSDLGGLEARCPKWLSGTAQVVGLGWLPRAYKLARAGDWKSFWGQALPGFTVNSSMSE